MSPDPAWTPRVTPGGRETARNAPEECIDVSGPPIMGVVILFALAEIAGVAALIHFL